MPRPTVSPTTYPINVRIPDRMIQQKIRRDAKEEGLSLSAIIRRIVIRHYAAAGRSVA
jgi:hypothetical protein